MLARRLLFIAGVVIAIMAIGGILAFRAHVRALTAGKVVRTGTATIVEVRDLRCTEAVSDVLEGFVKTSNCAPDERVLRLYLQLEHFPALTPDQNKLLLSQERTKESKGIWRCEDRQYSGNERGHFLAGESEPFQFQFFPSVYSSSGSALIFLSVCKR
jgi:hypothetical protein